MAFVMIKQLNRVSKVEVSALKVIGDEEISFSAPVNTTNNFFPKLGWLVLTKTHLTFVQEVKKNKEPLVIEIELSSIEDVVTTKYRLNSNAILITYNGKEQKFLMDGLNPKERIKNFVWVEKIKTAQHNYELTTE